MGPIAPLDTTGFEGSGGGRRWRRVNRPRIELLVNGDFSDGDTNWVVGTDWAVAAGAATKTPGAASTDTLEYDGTLNIIVNKFYNVRFTIADATAGEVHFTLGGVDGTVRTEDGTYSQTIKAVDGTTLVFTPDEDFDGSISDVSVARV